MATTIISIEDLVRKTTDLPTLPVAALKVIQESGSSTASAATVAQTLMTDQALSAKVLRLANSAFYGLPRQVKDLQEAVVVLGMRTVRNLAMVASTYPWMTKPLSGYDLGPKAMWTHSFGVAVGAQLVAKQAKIPNDDMVFTAGLLHDLGKVALSVWLDKKLAGVVTLAQTEGISFDAAERKVLGYDHTQVGAYLAEAWNLPSDFTSAIRYHHSPNECEPTSTVVDCVHMGDYLTMTMGFGLGGDGLQYPFCPEVLARLGLDESQLDSIVDSFVTSYERYEAMFENLNTA